MLMNEILKSQVLKEWMKSHFLVGTFAFHARDNSEYALGVDGLLRKKMKYSLS